MKGSADQFELPDPATILPGASHLTVARELSSKYDLKHETELHFVMERLEGLAMQEPASNKTSARLTKRRKNARESAEKISDLASNLLENINALANEARSFCNAVGRPPSASLIRAVLSDPKKMASKAQKLPSYAELVGEDGPFMAFPRPYQVIEEFTSMKGKNRALMSLIREMSRIQTTPGEGGGKMPNLQLRSALIICFEYCTKENIKWSNTGLRKKNVQKTDDFTLLVSQAEKLVTDLLRLAGIPFTLKDLSGRWREIEPRLKRRNPPKS